MILTCPECTTRYRLDASLIPVGGRAVRCKRCRAVFRARHPHADGAALDHHPGGTAAGSMTATPGPKGPNGSSARSLTVSAGAGAQEGAARPEDRQPPRGRASRPGSGPHAVPAPVPSGMLAPHAVAAQPPAADAPAAEAGPVAGIEVPVRVVPAPPSPKDEEIKRLTRIILSDIVIYSPEKAEKAVRDGRFLELFRSEVEEGRRMIRTRFPEVAGAVETYERCVRDLVEDRRKELLESAGTH